MIKKTVGMLGVVVLGCFPLMARVTGTRGIEPGLRCSRLVITEVMVIDGNGTPPRGPLMS